MAYVAIIITDAVGVYADVSVCLSVSSEIYFCNGIGH